MNNFNGQLKKRSVNLGGGFRQNRTNLLQQTQKERERRERERQREKSYRAVHMAVQRRLELLQFKLQMAQDWNKENVESGKYTVDSLLFWFNCFYADTYTRNHHALDHIELLHKALSRLQLSEATDLNKVGLLRTVADTIPHLQVLKESDLKVLGIMLTEAISLMSSPPKNIRQGSIPIIKALSNISAQLTSNADYSLINPITKLANFCASFDTTGYIQFLTSPWLIGFPNFHVNYHAINIAFAENRSLPSDIDTKINVLVALIDLCTGYDDRDFVLSITHIVSSIDTPLVTKVEDSSNAEDDEQFDKYKQKIINNQYNESIKKLYTREFISTSSVLLKGSPLHAILFASLITLKPILKTTLIIYMIPNVLEPLLDTILNHDVIGKLSNVSEESLFAVTPELLNDIFVQNADFIRYELFLFLELLKYRLIISNDFEIFKEYGFTKKKFISLSLFLKKFVFNLLWNGRKIIDCTSAAKTKKFSIFSNLCTQVLSQIYLKDARLNILQKGSWLVSPQRLDISNMATTIAQYGEKKDDYMDDSDDEGDAFLGTLSPDSQAKMEIYLKAPFFIAFEKRVEIFQVLIEMDRAKLGFVDNNMFAGFMNFGPTKQTAVIRREHLVDDAFDSFNKLGDAFKSSLSIVFMNKHGREEGIDGGGITKEFLTGVVEEGFKDLFVENYNHELYPNPDIGLKYHYRIHSEEQLRRLSYTNFMGKIIGKCLYERVLVDATFAPFFLTKFNTDYKNSFDDLSSLDPELYSNLVKLLKLTGDELESLGLTFSLDERVDQKTITIDLIPKGSSTPVTTTNRLKFIHEVSNYKLNKLLNLQSNSFLNGLYEIISKDWLAMFNPYELQLLISGENDVDIADLKANTEYGGYSADDETVHDFWEIVEEMTSDERFQLVKFVTSVPRAPLLGFKALNPKFGIRNTGPDTIGYLPTSSTCVNLLRLPNYRNKSVLKEKLLYAIKADAGFDLA